MTQDSRDSSSSVVLEVVTSMLWRHDDTELRIADVCRATGLSSSVIYNHFGSRQGLVDAAYLSLYCQASEQMLSQLRQDTENIDSLGAFYEYLHSQVDDPERAHYWLGLRQMRLRVATAAVARAGLRADFAAAQDRHLVELAKFLGQLQERGLVRTQLSPDQLARVFEAYVLSHTYNDIALHPASGVTWVDTLWTLLNPHVEATN